MATTREEVQIRLGMDSSTMRAEMNSASAFTQASMNALANKATSLLKANLYLAVVDLMRQAIPTAKEFWDGVYGTDEESMAKVQKSVDNIKKITSEVKSAKAELESGVAASVLENATPARRAGMLQDSLFAKKQQVADAKSKVAELAGDLDFTKGTKAVEARNEIVLKYGEAIKTVTKLQMEQLAIEKAYKAARDAMWAAEPPKLAGPNYPKQALMNTMLPLTNLPFMGGLKGAIDETNVGIAIFEAMHRKPMSVIIKGVDGP